MKGRRGGIRRSDERGEGRGGKRRRRRMAVQNRSAVCRVCRVKVSPDLLRPWRPNAEKSSPWERGFFRRSGL